VPAVARRRRRGAVRRVRCRRRVSRGAAARAAFIRQVVRAPSSLSRRAERLLERARACARARVGA
jgi:hypothetical protein